MLRVRLGLLLISMQCNGTIELFKKIAQFAEKLVSLIPHASCKFAYLGCTVVVDKKTKSEHEKKCRYRDVQCCFRRCLERVPFSQFQNHMYSHEITQEKFKSRQKMDFYVKQQEDWCFCFPVFFAAKKHNIFFEVIRQKETWYFWSFYYGTVKQAKRVITE